MLTLHPIALIFLLAGQVDGGTSILSSSTETGVEKSAEAEEEKPEEQNVATEEDGDSGEAMPVDSEMDQLRAVEEQSVDPEGQSLAQRRALLNLMGIAHPLRHHLEYAFEDLDYDSSLILTAPVSLISNLALFDIARAQEKYDIPIEMQPLVEQYIRFFQGRGRHWFRKWMSRSTRYIPLFQPILSQHGMPKDTVYLSMIESGFSPNAYSWAHASGPWQFISSTGKMYQLKQDFWVDERRDPIKSTHAASRFLTQLYRELGHWHLAWAAYNTGGGRVRRVINKKGTNNFWKISQGRGLAKETKHYVPKLIAAALVAKHYREFGFTDEEFDYQEPFAFEEVKVDAAVDLDVLAQMAGISTDELRELNPELKRFCTPPATAEQPYILRVPQGHAQAFNERYPDLSPSSKLQFAVHRIVKGDTLSKIALKYKTLPELVMRMNALGQPKALKIGMELAIPLAPEGSTADDLKVKAEQARLAGFVAPKAEEEVPAGIYRKTASGSVTRESVNGQTRITYGVAQGDSLWLISQRFGCTVEDLLRWNHLNRKSKLRIGMALLIWTKKATTRK